MATYHLSFKKGKCGYAVAHVNYILREGKYSEKRSGKEDLVYKESGNLPDWAKNPQEFWRASDDFERVNGVAYFEFEIALPNELDHEENKKLVQNFIAETVGNAKPFSFAIHEKNAALADEIKQPHAHIMFCERRIEKDIKRSKEKFFSRYNFKHPERGGAKKDSRFTSMSGRKTILEIRKKWEEHVNKKYEEKGLKIKVSSASLRKQYKEAIAQNDIKKAQAFDRPAEPHLGPKEVGKIKRETKNFKTKREYYVSFASEKAYAAYLARIIKEKTEELLELRNEIEKFEKQEQKNNVVIEQAKKLEPEIIKVAGREISDLLTQHITYMEKQRKEMIAAKNNLRKYILPDERLRLIAESVYTKKGTTQLRKQFNDIEKREEIYATRLEKWKNSKPGTFDLVHKYQYVKEKQALDAFRIDLDLQKEKYEKREALIKEELSKAEVQEKINTIIKELHAKVEIAKQRHAVYEKNVNIVKNQILMIRNIKREIDREYYGHYLKIRGDTYKNLQVNSINQGKNIINDLRYAINKAADNKIKTSSKVQFTGKSYDEGREE